jgi:lipid-A-disaccharide synthase
VAAAKALLDGSEAADAQVAGFATIRRLMEAGTPEDPRVDPAERVLNYWPSK